MPNLVLQREAMSFPQGWPADAQALFDPAIVDVRGAYVVGCPSAVVRESQVQGEASGQVYVLGSDGSIHGFDDGLTNKVTAKFAAPLRPELVMGELPLPSGGVACRLYYIDKSGAIVAVNGSVSP